MVARLLQGSPERTTETVMHMRQIKSIKYTVKRVGIHMQLQIKMDVEVAADNAGEFKGVSGLMSDT
jgi:hypothetical protein